MARKISRKTKSEVRWDASTGGVVPNVTFKKETREKLESINSSDGFISILEHCCGMFLLCESIEENKPTAGDYQKTLDDLEQVTDKFIDRLQRLEGHELQGYIDSAWYGATKSLPDTDSLKHLALNFRQQVRVAQAELPAMIGTKGRTNTTAPIRQICTDCKEAMTRCGSSDAESEDGYRAVVKICLNAIGKSHLVGRLRHYCN